MCVISVETVKFLKSIEMSGNSSALQSEALDLWVPSKCTAAVQQPLLRLICFHGAGMEQSIFTSRGTAKNPQSNVLLDFCLNEQISLLALQFPGRGKHAARRPLADAKVIALELLDVLKPLLMQQARCPYALCAHSMGALCAYELLVLIKENCIPLPKHIFISCMMSPDTENHFKTWKKVKDCNTAELQEELRYWGANAALFEPSMWKIYEQLIRDDFAVFDNYKFDKRHDEPLGIPCTCCYASKDPRMPLKLMKGWEHLLNGESEGAEFVEISGSHSFFYDPNARDKWMKHITLTLERILLDIIYS